MKYVELELYSISISIWDFVKNNYGRRILSNMGIWYILLV